MTEKNTRVNTTVRDNECKVKLNRAGLTITERRGEYDEIKHETKE